MGGDVTLDDDDGRWRQGELGVFGRCLLLTEYRAVGVGFAVDVYDNGCFAGLRRVCHEVRAWPVPLVLLAAKG